MDSPTEVLTVCVDEPTPNPTDISKSLEEIEKELARLKWQHQGNVVEREIQQLLQIVQRMKKTNQNLVHAIQETKKKDEEQEMEGVTNDGGQSSGGRARESGSYFYGGSQSVFGVGGIGSTTIHSNNSPVTVGSMASPTEALPVGVDEPTQNPTDILKSLEEIEKELAKLKWQHQGRNLVEREIQELLKIVQRMKKTNQNLLHAIQETKKIDEEEETEGLINDGGQSSGGRARESRSYFYGGRQSILGVGGIGSTSIHSTNSPVTLHTPEIGEKKK